MNDRTKEFRSAEMIELHEAGIVLRSMHCPDSFVGWYGFPFRGQVFTWVENLSARIASATLLEMEVEVRDEGVESKKMKASYVGSFTVWWKNGVGSRI